MKKILKLDNAIQLINGASILATGGGVPVEEELKVIKNLRNFKTSLVSLEDLPEDGFLCLVGELGPSGAPPIKKNKIIKQMLKSLEKITSKKIVGIYPPEIGQESVVLESAYYLDLPVADLDIVGGRAVPFIDINVFNLKNINYSLTPMVVCNDRDEIFIIEGNKTHGKVEEILREMTRLSSSELLFLMGALVSVKDLIKYKLENNSYSKALNLGSTNNLNELFSKLNPDLIIKGTVKKKGNIKQQGFSAAYVLIKDEKQNLFKLILQNEAIFLLDGKNKIISSVPEKILLIDPIRLIGLQNDKLTLNQILIIAILKPEKIWMSKKAEQIFGRNRFKDLLKKVIKI